MRAVIAPECALAIQKLAATFKSDTAEEPTLVVRADSATDSSPLARVPETGSPLSGERNNMAPPTRTVGSLHLAAQREPTGLPERVLNTISEARAPSTRRLYVFIPFI